VNVVVSLDHRFERTPDGAVWTQTQFGYAFWARYLGVFDGVRVICRAHEVPAPTPGWTRADGPGFSLAALPPYVGAWQYLRAYRTVGRLARGAIRPGDAVLLRSASTVAPRLAGDLCRAGRPYGVEVVADPYDVFAPGSVKHPLRPLLRWWVPRQVRRVCRHACAAGYVTERALQDRYPPGPGAFVTHYSSIELSDAAFVAGPRTCPPAAGVNVLLVGTLAQLYKGPDVLIDAVAACVRDGLDLRLTVVGDGRHRPGLEARAAGLGLNGRARFRGQLTAGDAVREELDKADLFVLPSYQEGLPRAVVEAMARGLACIGSTVGGFPELLPAEELVPPGDAAALARKIREVVTDPDRMARMSARNLARARQYRDAALRPRREAMYRHLRDETTRWLRTQPR
jgi:glycosyltransferase involved in cell wall biosynthesis